MYEYELEHIRLGTFELDFFLVPWDTEILDYPVGQIERIRIDDPDDADKGYRRFSGWLGKREIRLCSVKIEQHAVQEVHFLEKQGFRFIELNYFPVFSRLQNLEPLNTNLSAALATADDHELLTEMAGTIFTTGRFHCDPRIGPRLGNRRYREWMRNSFTHDRQEVLKIVHPDGICAFSIIEDKGNGTCFWHLGGVAQNFAGPRIGLRFLQTTMEYCRKEGIKKVETSISSQNTIILNLYSKLGFRFMDPMITLHWFNEIKLPVE